VRESNPPRPLAIETELPSRGSYEGMCSDTVHEARPSPPSDRRTIQIGAIRPAHADPLSLRTRAASRSGQCAFPSALTRQLRADTTSRRFRVHVRSRLPARRQRSLVHSLLPSTPQVTTRCPVAFERIHSRYFRLGAIASVHCQSLLPRVAPRLVYATAITRPCQQSRQLHSDPT